VFRRTVNKNGLRGIRADEQLTAKMSMVRLTSRDEADDEDEEDELGESEEEDDAEEDLAAAAAATLAELAAGKGENDSSRNSP